MRTLACRTIVATGALCAGLALCLSHPALAVDAAAPQPAVGEPSASPNPTDAERIRILEQQVRMLQERLEQLESAAMVGRPAAAATEPQVATQTEQPVAGEDVAAGATAVGREASPAEVRDEHVLLTGPDLISEEFLGSWPMFGSNLRMKVGGYVKADAVYDFDGTTDPYQFLMSTIPVEGTPEYEDGPYVKFFSRETRFNIDVRRATPGAVPLRAFLEGDFWSAGNQFRLRHAYLTVNNFIVGQTWTTLSFVESLPFMIDFGAGDALFGGRTTQIRYQRKVSERWKYAVALENLDFAGIENPSSLPGRASSRLPLFAVRADYHWKSGLLLMGSSVGQLRWDGGAGGPDATALQVDGVVAGRQYLGTRNYFTWNVSYGKGSGENIMAFAGSEANAVLTADGRLETIPAFAVVLGYWHEWSEEWSSNLSYAYGWLDTPESRDPLALKRGGIGHVNLIWRPVPQFSSGIEYMWGAERTTDLSYGSASRLQGMVKFDF